MQLSSEMDWKDDEDEARSHTLENEESSSLDLEDDDDVKVHGSANQPSNPVVDLEVNGAVPNEELSNLDVEVFDKQE